MKFKNFLELYDDWNGITVVNDNKLNIITKDHTVNIYDSRKDLCDKEIVAFGFYNGELTVRIK